MTCKNDKKKKFAIVWWVKWLYIFNYKNAFFFWGGVHFCNLSCLRILLEKEWKYIDSANCKFKVYMSVILSAMHMVIFNHFHIHCFHKYGVIDRSLFVTIITLVPFVDLRERIILNLIKSVLAFCRKIFQMYWKFNLHKKFISSTDFLKVNLFTNTLILCSCH